MGHIQHKSYEFCSISGVPGVIRLEVGQSPANEVRYDISSVFSWDPKARNSVLSLVVTSSYCRYSVEQVCELLQCLGLQNVSAFESNGVTGGELLELSQEELRTDLGLSTLQVIGL